MSSYVVVEFDKQYGGCLAAVHKSWFTPLKKEVFWPPYKEQQRFDRALRNGEVVDEKNWKLFSVSRIFYETDDILKARQKLKEAELTSNLESEQEEVTNARRKRRIKKNKVYNTSDDESSDQELPRPPPVKRPILNAVSSDCGKEYTNLSQSHLILNEPLEFPRTPQASTRNNSLSANLTTVCCNSPASSTTDQLTVTDKLISLVSHIKEQNDQILAWIAKQNKNSVNNTEFGMPDTPFLFPLETVEELDQFDGYVSDDREKFVAIASYLATLGGNSVTSKTNRILKHVMSDVVATKFNYYGQRSQKRAFSELMLKKLIVGAVKKGIPNSTDKEVEDVMKVWLKHAQERIKKKNATRKD